MLNIYEQFIDYLKKVEMEERRGDCKQEVEKHHILPKFAGGKDANNTVYCSSKNHILAHFYRFLVYGEKGDWVCYSMRKNQKIGARERALLAVKKQRQLKINFWDFCWQRKQGLKGGVKGGKKKSLLQFKARQKVGLKFGSKTGLKNQSAALKKNSCPFYSLVLSMAVYFFFFTSSLPTFVFKGYRYFTNQYPKPRH